MLLPHLQWRPYTLAHFPVSPRYSSSLPLISVSAATFYRRYPSPQDSPASNLPLFPSLSFSLPANDPSSPSTQQHWAVLSPSSLARTTFLHILSGRLLAIPPAARSYPALVTHPSAAITYVGFDAERSSAGSGIRGAYLSARYESRRESGDWTLGAYLRDQTELNPTGSRSRVDEALLQRCVADLRLEKLLNTPVANLSNGQTRRARITKALLGQPRLLLLDGPFQGLDPPSVTLLSTVLRELATQCRPGMVLSLRAGDPVPDWTTHLVSVADTSQVLAQGPKAKVLSTLPPTTSPERKSVEGLQPTHPPRTLGEAIVQISAARITYLDSPQPVLGANPSGLSLTLRRGQCLLLLGANGSGKTTLLSLITSDHPQSYAQNIRLFGRPRIPDSGEKGMSLFELQRRIGHASPEVHAFFPKHISIRRAIQSAWADAPLARPDLNIEKRARVDTALAYFAPDIAPSSVSTGAGGSSDLDWADVTSFGESSFSAQRTILFVRATIAEQDLVVLDEAFSGMDRAARTRAFRFLAHGTSDGKLRGLSEDQALLCVAHEKGDVPGVVREWMCLPEPVGEGEVQSEHREGVLEGPLELSGEEVWEGMWGRT